MHLRNSKYCTSNLYAVAICSFFTYEVYIGFSHVGVIEKIVIPKRREIHQATLNIPDLPAIEENVEKKATGRPNTGGPMASQQRKRQKKPRTL
jgi:hypothetical protein